MRNYIGLIIALFVSNSYACNLENAARHTNPDGNLGGFVSKQAKVAPTAYVSSKARVCDRAKVEGNAQILEDAIVKENSWIRDFAVVRGRAIVSGSAVVRGGQNFPAIVEGRARVYGNSHIEHGTTVTDSAIVYGSVKLENSTVMAIAEVCEGVSIVGLTINDNYFCSQEQIPSRIQIFPVTYKVGYANKMASKLKFQSAGFKFLPDASLFKVFVNDVEIPPTDFRVTRDEVVIFPGNSQIEGWNEFKIEGVDEYGKRISPEEGIELHAGSGTRTLSVLNVNENSSEIIKTKFLFKAAEGDLEGVVEFANDELTIYGVTNDLNTYSVSLSGVGEKSFFIEEFDSFESLPEEIEAGTLPLSPSSVLDFSDNLSSWKTSHPENISIVVENGKKVVKVAASADERVELAKRFSLNRDTGQIKFGLVLPGLSKVIRNQAGKVEVFVISMKTKEINRSTYNVVSEIDRSKSAYAMNDFGKDEAIYILRISPSIALAKADDETTLTEQEKSKIAVSFVLRNMTAFNGDLLSKAANLSSVRDSVGGCQNNIDFLSDGNITFHKDETYQVQEFLSVGNVFTMRSHLFENRIYADISLVNAKKKDVKNFKIVGEQNGIEMFTQGFKETPCGEAYFSALSGEGRVLARKHYHSLGHIFSIPFGKTMGVSREPNSRINLFIEVELNDGYKIKSEVRENTILISPNIPDSDVTGDMDSYVITKSGDARTGGDKWILPGYENEVITLLNPNQKWKINDLSKLNGGVFPGHSSHRKGIDVDLTFDGLNFKTFGNDETKWKDALDDIENLIIFKKSLFKTTETIFITSRLAGNDFIHKYIANRFENRCIDDDEKSRYIDLDSPVADKSLLNNEKDHHHHIHFTFNVPGGDGRPVDSTFFSYDFTEGLDDLKFMFDEKGIKIEPREPEKFKTLKVLWRYQKVIGFNQPESGVQYGKWYLNNVTRDKTGDTIVNEGIKYLDVVFASPVAGNCYTESLQIDFSTKTIKRRDTKDGKNWRLEEIL